jgi:hypothetical protein
MTDHVAYEEYYKAKLESGLLYQDFVVDQAATSLGFVIATYGSRAYQAAIGESHTGVDIKHDEKLADTGNLWIEVGEKARQRKGTYVPSGIRRSDNSCASNRRYQICNCDP